MDAATAIKNFVRDIRDIDRKTTILRQARDQKVRALRKAQADQAMSCSAVRHAPAMSCT